MTIQKISIGNTSYTKGGLINALRATDERHELYRKRYQSWCGDLSIPWVFGEGWDAIDRLSAYLSISEPYTLKKIETELQRRADTQSVNSMLSEDLALTPKPIPDLVIDHLKTVPNQWRTASQISAAISRKKGSIKSGIGRARKRTPTLPIESGDLGYRWVG